MAENPDVETQLARIELAVDRLARAPRTGNVQKLREALLAEQTRLRAILLERTGPSRAGTR